MKPGGESPVGMNWGEIHVPFDCTAKSTLATCPIRTNTKFNTLRNFTHYIKPGDRLIGVDTTGDIAAVRGDLGRAELRGARQQGRPRHRRSRSTCPGFRSVAAARPSGRS